MIGSFPGCPAGVRETTSDPSMLTSFMIVRSGYLL